jgi:hypothetical protein
MATIRRKIVVAIPVRNEADRIVPCLQAIEAQQATRADKVILLLNNCTDDTADRIRAIAPLLTTPCATIQRSLYGAEATAGFARSVALRHAAAGLSDEDILITTDADGTVDPMWMSENLHAINHGAEAVCGQADIDPAEAHLIPAHLHQDDVRECRLNAMLDEISSLLDPDPHDPLPRHTQEAGASIAVTVGAWRRAGGMPPVPTGEDRAFIENLRRVDARIRHARAVRVTVSARAIGRAAGGMADTIRRRMIEQDEFTDAAIEPAMDRYRRMTFRARARAAWSAPQADHTALAQALGVSRHVVIDALTHPYFGQAWVALQEDCPTLLQRRVRFLDLPREIEAARILLAAARSQALAEHDAALVDA